MNYILVVKTETEQLPSPRKSSRLLKRRGPMRTLTTMVEWSAIAVALYAAISFATSAQALANLA